MSNSEQNRFLREWIRRLWLRIRGKERLATRYLILSLLAALIPLSGMSVLYNAYFSELMARVSDPQVTARLAATQNELRNLISDMVYKVDRLRR